MESIISKGISEIGEVPWNALAAGRPFQRYAWYRFGETVMGTDSYPTYVLLKQDGQLCSGASFWRVPNEPIPFEGRIIYRALESFLRRWPLIICRSPFSGTPGLIIPPESSREDSLKEITRLGRRLRREEKASLLIFDSLDAKTARTWPGAISYSYEIPGMILNTKANSFDEYIASLPNKEGRNIRHDLRRIEDQGISVTRHRTLSDEDCSAAERLYHMVEKRKGPERSPWVSPMLANIQLVNGTWLAAHNAAGELVGCVTEFEDNGMQMLTHLGLSETTQYVYFALLYESIRLGMERRLHSYYWGAGTYAVKKRLGFVPIENDSIAITL